MLVGFLMMQQVKGIDWDDLEIAIPAFLTIVLMPFTYSITVGIGAGFLAYVLIKLVRRQGAQVHPLMWVVAALFVVYFAHRPDHQLAHLRTAPPGVRVDQRSPTAQPWGISSFRRSLVTSTATCARGHVPGECI